MIMDCIQRTRVTVRLKGSLNKCLRPMPVEKRWTTTTKKAPMTHFLQRSPLFSVCRSVFTSRYNSHA